MIRYSLTFLSGAALSAAVMFSAGGGIRAGLILGFGLLLALLAVWPSQAARVLLAFAEARTVFHVTVKANSQRKQPAAAKLRELPRLTPIQADVQSALINLGMSRGEAFTLAAATKGQDFETAFREAQAAA